jgi:hypothetical protein
MCSALDPLYGGNRDVVGSVCEGRGAQGSVSLGELCVERGCHGG